MTRRDTLILGPLLGMMLGLLVWQGALALQVFPGPQGRGGAMTALRVTANTATTATIAHPSIRTTSVISVTIESTGSTVGQVAIDGPVSDGGFNVIISGQDNAPFLHVIIVN